jgi:hypothetical protein
VTLLVVLSHRAKGGRGAVAPIRAVEAKSMVDVRSKLSAWLIIAKQPAASSNIPCWNDSIASRRASLQEPPRPPSPTLSAASRRAYGKESDPS